MKDRARETLRDDDDDDGASLIRGGEGVRPLTAHTPILSRDEPEDPKARAPTLQMPAIQSSAASPTPSPSPPPRGGNQSGLKDAAKKAQAAGAPEADKKTDTQRVAAMSRIEQAMASLSGAEIVGPEPTPGEGDGSETVVNPVVADADTVLGRTGSGSNKSLAGGKKGAPRPRRRPQTAPDDAEGPATIKIPVMTPSRLRELGEMNDADAFAAIDKTVSLPKRKSTRSSSSSKEARETLGDLPNHKSKRSAEKAAAKAAASQAPSDSPAPDTKGVPHSAFAQPTLMANLDELEAGRAKKKTQDAKPRGDEVKRAKSATAPSSQAAAKPKASAAKARSAPDEKPSESTKLAAPHVSPSETDLAEGPTMSGTGDTGEDGEWEEPTVAEEMQTFGTKGDAASLLSAEVRPGLPRPSHRVATMAPVAALSGMGPAESDADVSELETSDVRPGEIASQQSAKQTEALGKTRGGEVATQGVDADGPTRRRAKTPTSPRPALAASSKMKDAEVFDAPKAAQAFDDKKDAKRSAQSRKPKQPQVELPAPPVGSNPRENKTNVLGTIDLDPTDDASAIEAIQREARTHQLGTPEAGKSVRSQPPPAPHTYHDDDDDALPPNLANVGDPPELGDESESAEMRAGAAAAIAKAEAEFDANVEPAFPDKIGIYKIERPIGEGGMAEVFRAQHPSRGQVVLKRMRPSLLVEKRYVEMFVREAKIATTLQHENIVATLDFGAADGAHYLVMEELVGMSLRDLADRVWEAGRSLPLEVILRSCAGAARGLHHAHTTASLVHRDVSPDNVFVTGDGPTKMLDFGIAKQPDSARLTRTGEIKGKVPFMSPEHILGDPPVSGQSDVWSLAVTLYWLLCGVRPFDGSTDVMTLQSVVEAPHAPATQRNNALPADIDIVVDKALQKRPADRYATAADFADALDAAARALVPVADDETAWAKIDRQVSATIAEATQLPLPSRPARAPYPACVSVFSAPPAADDGGRVLTEAMVTPKKSNSTLWLVAGLMVGAMGALVLAAFFVAEFVVPRCFGSGGG